MIPESFATLLAFLGLIAPGLVYALVRERRAPAPHETAFREASRIALTSLLFTAASALVLLGMQRGLRPGFLPDFAAWLTSGTRYAAANLPAVVTALVAAPALSCAAAALVAWWRTRSSEATISSHGAWYQILRNERPPGTRAWVHLRLKDETQLWGYLRHYATQDDADVREIVLGGDTLMWQLKSATTATRMGDRWDAVSVNAADISFLRVTYRHTDGRTMGRATPQEPLGSPRPASP